MKRLALCLAVALSPLAAQAAEITLVQPMQGATLIGAKTDMSVYFTQGDAEAYRVHAAYVAKDNDGKPQQLVMELNEGDAVSFSLPGHKTEIYSFSRVGDTLQVNSVELTSSPSS